MLIEIFQPAEFKDAPLSLKRLNELSGEDNLYASSGKAALFHILRALKGVNKVLLPAYICEEVLVPIEKLGIKTVFSDIDPRDLNADIGSIRLMCERHKPDVVLVASLYGNPANLSEIEKYCKEKNVRLIDDAAQSFGAKLDRKYVGSFGDAGFFSFSPGKPTAGHMGAFFWLNDRQYSIRRKHHAVSHLISYFDFYFNRLKIYKYRKYGVFRAVNIFKRIMNRYIDLTDDDIEAFEKRVLGGVLKAVFDGQFGFRRRCLERFEKEIALDGSLKLVKAVRGEPNNHKIVLLAETKDKAREFIEYLKKKAVYSSNGYPLLGGDQEDLTNARKLEGRVVEIPIENNADKMAYLFDTIKGYLRGNID